MKYSSLSAWLMEKVGASNGASFVTFESLGIWVIGTVSPCFAKRDDFREIASKTSLCFP